MDAHRFDLIVRSLGWRRSRRNATRLLAGSVVGGLLVQGALSGDAKKKKKKKKCKAPKVKCGKACCPDGQSCLDGQCGTAPPPPPPGTTTTAAPQGPNPACPGPPTASLTGTRRLAQTFLAERTGQLAAAECLLGSTGSGTDFTLEIRTVNSSGVPTTTVLASDTVPNLPAVPADTPLTGVFVPPAPVETGVRYAFVVTTGPGQGLNLRIQAGGVCPGQELFNDPNATDAFSAVPSFQMILSASIVV